ncbi:DUF1810 domain-containing protein [Paracoccus aestuariivivens]|uniref:DUF1810 family protein n=1 Tax=Paracoccus aestuariivivens TaxID=1820333 RepID=A0A6L6JBB0_9RHOB|nr:DUF1810 domain-containing protein [Paracoccus aestuariivivens]MTH78418.1 DUF1810 family protein [Paracoccus aestuariivivens]
MTAGSRDPDALARFTAAQRDCYDVALAELRAGRKQSHWMWFIFPQLRGLGMSERSHFYGIADLDEARRYLDDPVLGPRLIACCKAVLAHADRPPEAILGSVDAGKLRSSATLFAAVPGADGVFGDILETFFGSIRCRLTLNRLGDGKGSGHIP